jgi:hypothetical protein
MPARLDPPQLVDADGSLQIHHVVLEAGLHDPVVLVAFVAEPLPGVLTHAVQGQNLDASGVLLVAGENHASLASYHALRNVEAKAAKLTEPTSFPSPVFRLDSMGTVLN